jgi:hypothetical protein
VYVFRPEGAGVLPHLRRDKSCVLLCSLGGAPPKGVILGVALSLKIDQLKVKIPGVCDAQRLVRCRPSGGHKRGYSDIHLSFHIECLPDKVMLGYVIP